MSQPNPYAPGLAEPQFGQPFPAGPPPVTGLGDPPAPVRAGEPHHSWPQPHPAAPDQGPPPPPPPAAEPVDEQDVILPAGELLTLTSGLKVRIKPLRTRELLALVNIGVAGVGPRLGDLALDPDADTDVFVARFAGLILAGLGSAGDEACAFLRMVCEPDGKVSTFRPDRAQRARNQALDAQLDAELHNPHPDDTISIIERVTDMNAGDLQAWGKRLAGIWKLAQRTGQIPASRTSTGYPS